MYEWRTDPTHTRERGFSFPCNSEVDRVTAWMLKHRRDLITTDNFTVEELRWLDRFKAERKRKKATYHYWEKPSPPSPTRDLPHEAARCFRLLGGDCVPTHKCKHEKACAALKRRLKQYETIKGAKSIPCATTGSSIWLER